MNAEQLIPLDDLDDTKRMMVLEMAFGLVSDSSDWVKMPTDARVEEVSRAFRRLMMLVEGGSETYC